MQTVVTIAGWIMLAYAAGGVATALIYLFLGATVHWFDLLAIAFLWPLWMLLLITGGK